MELPLSKLRIWNCSCPSSGYGAALVQAPDMELRLSKLLFESKLVEVLGVKLRVAKFYLTSIDVKL